MKVLVGVDGSAGGFAAVRLVGQLLSAERDQIALYYTPPEVRLHPGSDAGPEIIERAQQALADAVFQEARARLPDALVATAHTIVGTKNPRVGILLAADEWRAELIVMGARGSSPIKKLLVGSAVTSIVHGSTVPVLVVRPPPKQAMAPGPLRALLAWDGSEASRQAAAVLERFTWPADTSGCVITVVESLSAGAVPQWLEKRARDADSEAMAQAWIHEHEAEKQEKRGELARFCQQLPVPFQNSTPIVAEGHAAEQILLAIAAEKADLVVLGTHGKGVLERLLIGSTSEKVLAHAPCSVLLVREHLRP